MSAQPNFTVRGRNSDVLDVRPKPQLEFVQARPHRLLHIGDFKGLRHFRENTGGRFSRGILLYTGSTAVAFEKNLHALPMSALRQLETENVGP